MPKSKIDLNSAANPLSDVDIIGLGIGGDFTFAMGGGKSLEFIFFLDGANAGTWQTYTVQRGNVGIAGGYSIYGIVGDFYNDSLLDANAYTEYSFSSTTEIKSVLGGSAFWAPINYKNDQFGIKSYFNDKLRAWS
ncbi:hypothetical protein, partial [Chryseobacterium sp.]|uniref:hypothetical protein n=1 Tax=Chryseobacterium sp. TaxID=1871047 RepID=UPI0024E2418A